MVFWIGILVSCLFAWYTIKRGFYETWVLLFNIIISIYLAIYLKPIVENIVPAAGNTLYMDALITLATAAAFFVILHGLSYLLIMGQFSIPFPRIFDVFGAGFLGFLAGFLLWSFAGLLVCIAPISQNAFAKEIDLCSGFKKTNIPYVCWWCNLVNKAVYRKGHKYPAEQAINDLIRDFEEKMQDIASPYEPNEPAKPTEPAGPNRVKTGTREEKQPDLPTEIKMLCRKVIARPAV